jgi:hypothetical protein
MIKMLCIDPMAMCNKHISDEHNSIHLIYHAIKSKEDLSKIMSIADIDISDMIKRHNELVKEDEDREFTHQSGLFTFDEQMTMLDTSHVPLQWMQAKPHKLMNLRRITYLCSGCQERYREAYEVDWNPETFKKVYESAWKRYQAGELIDDHVYRMEDL